MAPDHPAPDMVWDHEEPDTVWNPEEKFSLGFCPCLVGMCLVAGAVMQTVMCREIELPAVLL